MYFTEALSGSVVRANMDGSDPVKLVTGVLRPAGIAIDFDSSRLIFAAYWTSTIKSCNLDGTDVRTIVNLPLDSFPYGIAIQDGRIFWGDSGGLSKSIRSCKTSGEDVRTLYRNAPGSINHVSVASLELRQTRKNDCEGVVCAGICVLTPDSYTCVH